MNTANLIEFILLDYANKSANKAPHNYEIHSY